MGFVADRSGGLAPAVTIDGNRDILGLWAGGGEGATFWLSSPS
ncbi:hypothetical protein HCB18_05860 [Salinispora arenicola]|nr:hypothetical protein [Salinispora arenicola]NIL62890.1 hypothetical protein [Salinispora arenicola]